MIDERKLAFDNISRMLAITRYDIEHHQSTNDQSLNIHGESYFRDVFNFVYGYDFKNANFETQNAPCVDLIDKPRKLAYQITTTRDNKKIEKTLLALKKQKYEGYTIRIFYLLDKSKPQKTTKDTIEKCFNIKLSEALLDYTDLIKSIENLETNQLIELDKKYFRGISYKYTDDIVLNLIFKHLISEKKLLKKRYDDDFGTIDTAKKIILNDINNRVAADINKGLDYTKIIEDIDNEDNLLTKLRSLIIDELYKEILIENLKSKVPKNQLDNNTVVDLHNLANDHNLNFNKIIGNLHEIIENNTEINDFNAMNIAWIIVSYFFEICDIGMHQT
ncbi:MAG: SMEK domain-containing protein [Methylococcaceae bacterium]